MPIVPTGSIPLFAFASDGSMAWLRGAGSRLLAVDTRTGEVLREVRLDPAPFGLTWHVERHDGVFVVRDDREIAAYAAATGARLWRRTWPTRLVIAGKGEGGKRITIVPGPDGVDVVEADLEAGLFEPKLRIQGTMDHVLANGVVAGGTLVVATDQREAWVIRLDGFKVLERHQLFGSRILPPVSTPHGVHVAVVERSGGYGPASAITKVRTIDPATGAIIATMELVGEAHAIAAGASGLVLDVTRSALGSVERVAFRPDAPQVRLVASKHVDMSLARETTALPAPSVQILAAPPAPPAGRHDEMIPLARGAGDLTRAGSPREGFALVLSLLGARSELLARLADAFDAQPRSTLHTLEQVGLVLRDPRVRWSARAGRDPCLVDLAEDRQGDTIATYLYPPGKLPCVPVLRVSRETGTTQWLADDFDAWLAGFLYDARASAPDLVAILLHDLGVGGDFPRPVARVAPPPWFFEAHDTEWTLTDAETALSAGDLEGAERMLVSAGRSGRARLAKARLESVYETLGWAHQRAVVAETW